MKPTVVFSSNENPLYLDFVEPVKKAWINMGFDVHVELLSNSKFYVDPNQIPIANQAQMIRALIPALYPDRTFILSDVDMLPLNSDYFINAANLPKEMEIVNISADAYKNQIRMPICYFIGTGASFSAVTDVKKIDDVPEAMKRWWSFGHGWDTDEICFTKDLVECVNNGKVSFTGYARGWSQGRANYRIDRDLWVYDEDFLKSGKYIDSHMLRPLTNNKHLLKSLFESVGVDI
jgi:hypothetical protein